MLSWLGHKSRWSLARGCCKEISWMKKCVSERETHREQGNKLLHR